MIAFDGMSNISSLDAAQATQRLEGLIGLLIDAVQSGASVGFVEPLEKLQAATYWQGVIADLARGSRVLLIAELNGRTVGTGQLVLESRANAPHRAEVSKVLVHSSARRRGVGLALMQALEREALSRHRTLLHLDTRAGDGAEALYKAVGYTPIGGIPNWARHPSTDALESNAIFYKVIEP